MQFIREEKLRESRIGLMVNVYSQHPKETLENRKKWETLLNRWIRPVLQLNDSYYQSSSYGEYDDDSYYASGNTSSSATKKYFFYSIIIISC